MANDKQPTRPQLAVTLPSDAGAEKALLKIFLTSTNTFQDVRSNLCKEDFHDMNNRMIFDCIEAVSNDGNEISIVSIAQKASAIHPEISISDIVEIASFDDGGNDWQYLTRVLNALRVRRTLWTILQDAAGRSLAYDEEPDAIVEQTRKQLDNIQNVGREHIVSIDKSLQELSNLVADNRDPSTRHEGTPTGFDYFDLKGGFQAGDLIVVGAESSQGKTSFAMSIALNALLHGETTGYYSLEMSREQLTARLVSMLSGVPSSNILYNPLSDDDQARFNAQVSSLKGRTRGNIFVDERPTSDLNTILAGLRTMKIKYGISGAVVDFLQRLRPARGMPKEQFIGECAQRLKDLAREQGIWIMALSQLSRDRDCPIPSLNRLRDSGQVNEAADVTILLYRPEAVIPFSSARTFPEPFTDKATNGHAMVMVAKGRNIGTGSFLCGFDAPTTRFYEKPLWKIPSVGGYNGTKKSNYPF